MQSELRSKKLIKEWINVEHSSFSITLSRSTYYINVLIVRVTLNHAVPSGNEFLHSTGQDNKIRRNSRRNALCLVVRNHRRKGDERAVGRGRVANALANTSMHTGEQRRMR